MKNISSLAPLLLLGIFATAQAQSVVPSYSSSGLSGLSYGGNQYLWHGDFRVNSVQMTTPSGTTVSADLNATSSFNGSSNQLTLKYSWGSITVLYAASGSKYGLAITTTNTSANTISQLNYEPLGIAFPSQPQEYDGVTPILATNIGTPTALTMTSGGTVAVLTNDDVRQSLLTGYPWSVNRPTSTNFPLYVLTGTNSMLPDSLPFITRPIGPGASDTYHISLRFAPTGTPLKTIVGDVYSTFAAAYPFTLNWTDHRPIGQLIIATTATGWASNPRGWLLDPTIDVTSPQGVAVFQTRLLAWADNAVAILKSMNAQGMITWDIEGEQFPQPTTYIGDPAQFATLAPEMSGVADAYFKKFTDAGLRVGVCLRPQQLVLGPGNSSAIQQSVADPAPLLISKINYARSRWGATLFYVDSNGLPSQPMDASVFQRVAAAVPGVLVIPEQKTIAYYSATAPYSELRLGYLSAPQQARDIYPSAFAVINTADGQIQQNFSQLQAAVRAGDVMLFRGWFNDPGNTLVQQLYGTSGPTDTTPPSVNIVSPLNNASVNGVFTASASATDDVGVIGVQFSIDGVAAGNQITTAPYSTAINTSSLSNGNHTLTATASDAAGNKGTASITIVVNNPDNVPPTVSITNPQNGATVSGSVTLTATATDNVGVAYVQFAVDGAATGAALTTPPYVIAFNTQSVGNGLHTISATAKDMAGNASTASVSVSVNNQIVDTVPPVVTIVSPTNGATVSGTLTLSATATDNVGVTSAQFFDGATALGPVLSSSPYVYVWNTLTATPGIHQILFKAYDAAGNVGSSSVAITVSNTAGTPVTVTLINPGNNTTIAGTINLQAQATASGNAMLQFLIDNVPYGIDFQGPPYSGDLNTNYLTDGVHTISARARDSQGNTAIATSTVTVSNHGIGTVSAPAITLAGVSNNSTVSGSVTVTASITNNAPVSSLQFFVDGAALGLPLSSAPYSIKIDTTKLSNAVHMISATATNSAGTGTANLNVTVNNSGPVTPPAISLLNPANNASISGTITVTAQATAAAGIATVRFYVDSTQIGSLSAAPFSTTFDSTKLSNGAHTITATVTDISGNTASTSASVKIANAGSQPVVALDYPPNNSTISGVITLQAQASASTGNPRVQFLIDAVPYGIEFQGPPYSGSLNTAFLTDGAHTISVRALDSNGTSSSATSAITVNNHGSQGVPPVVALSGPPNSSTVSGGVTLTASISNNVLVNSVQFYVDGSPTGPALTTSPYSYTVDTTKLSNASHLISAIATNGAGTGSDSVVLNVNNTGSGGVASIVLVSPANNTTVTGSLAVTAQVSAPSGVSSVQFYVDGAQIASFTAGPYSTTFDTTSLPNGAHTLMASVTDTTGNTVSTSASITVSNTGGNGTPTVIILNPALNATISGTITLSAQATVNSGTPLVQFLIDNVPYGIEFQSPPYSGALNTALLTNGQHLISARARDGYGNATVTTVVVTVRN